MTRILTIILYCGVSFSAYSQYATYITVAKDGSGDFNSIQEAINATKAFPEKDITLFIKNGTYKEKVRVYDWNTNLTIQGESKDSTIITWDDYFNKIDLGRNSTFHTYTFQVEANDVTLKNLTIKNAAGPVGQAVALHIDADRVVIKNCNILGDQDTLYATGENLRHYYENCLIEGTTDYIFGSATALFRDCIIRSKSDSYITAASTPKGVKYGFVFMDCQLESTSDVNEVLLGRPWRSFAKTVFINCFMGSHILPKGWGNWGSEEKESTVLYAEYQSQGPGANNAERVDWAKKLTNQEALSYTFENIFGDWRPQVD